MFMVSRGEEKYVIWPLYFDKNFTRLQGRKVAKKYAKEKVSSEEIEKAAKTLKLNPILEKNCAHPARFWKKEGRVLIDKKGSKSKLLIDLSQHL